jgi:hypothetical protein
MRSMSASPHVLAWSLYVRRYAQMRLYFSGLLECLLYIVLSDFSSVQAPVISTHKMLPLLGLRSSPQGALWALGPFHSPPFTLHHV